MPRTSGNPVGVSAHGDVTRARILDAAGRLFAERGYDGAESKDICALAGTNIAAVNYHFGGRDRLYVRVLEAANDHLMTDDALRGLADADLPAREKLSRFLEHLLAAVLDDQRWQPRLWAREMLSPSPHIDKVLEKTAKPKFRLLLRVLAEATGRATDDPELEGCLLGLLAPCMVLLVAHKDKLRRLLPGVERDGAAVAAVLQRFVSAGLDAFALPKRRMASPTRRASRGTRGKKGAQP